MREVFTVTAEGLKLHTSASRTAHVTDELTTGDEIEVVDRKNGTNWIYGQVIKTRSGIGVGESGWVDGSFGNLRMIDLPPPTEWPPDRRPKSQAWVLLVVAIMAAAITFIAYGVLAWKP